jgi:hypothetical protein
LFTRVFDLKENEVAAVLNHDQTVVYLIRVVQHMSTPEELRTAYLAEASTWPGLRLMMNGHARIAAAALVSDLITNAGLDWVRPPDRIAPEEEEAG